MLKEEYLKILREQSDSNLLRIGLKPYIKSDEELIINDIECSFEIVDDSSLAQTSIYLLSQKHLMSDNQKLNWINFHKSQILIKRDIIKIQIDFLAEIEDSKLSYGLNNTINTLKSKIAFINKHLDDDIPTFFL